MNKFIPQRRKLLQYGFVGLSVFMGNHMLPAPLKAATLSKASLGELLSPDENGVRLPKDFKSRVIVHSGQNLFGYT